LIFDAVPQSLFGRGQGADGRGNLYRGGDQNSDEVDGAQADACHAVEHKAAGGGVDQVDDIVELAGELMYVFPIERCDEALVQLGEDAMGEFVAIVLDGLDDLHLLGTPV